MQKPKNCKQKPSSNINVGNRSQQNKCKTDTSTKLSNYKWTTIKNFKIAMKCSPKRWKTTQLAADNI